MLQDLSHSWCPMLAMSHLDQDLSIIVSFIQQVLDLI